MSRQLASIAALACLCAAVPASGQVAPVDLPPQAERPDAAALVAQAHFRRPTRGDCLARAASGDIVVCAPLQDQALPVPEVYGPVPGSTDGAAVDPSGVPCGASISNQCGGGVDVIRTIGGAIKLVGLLLDPDSNLGEGTAIPERFRGSNR